MRHWKREATLATSSPVNRMSNNQRSLVNSNIRLVDALIEYSVDIWALSNTLIVRLELNNSIIQSTSNTLIARLYLFIYTKYTNCAWIKAEKKNFGEGIFEQIILERYLLR